MTMKIDRFEIVDMDYKKTLQIGIKDHQIDKIVVTLNEVIDKGTTLSLAESIIPVIENHLENIYESYSDSNGIENQHE